MAILEIRTLTKEEQEILDKLKIVFNEKTRTNVVRKLIKFSKDKYL